MHAEAIFQGAESIRDLEDALAAESFRQGTLDPFSFVHVRYRGTVDYEPHVRRYIQTFGRDSVHVILFDDFRADPLGVYRDLLTFLGVDNLFEPHIRVVNARRRPRSKTLHQLVLHHPEGLTRLLRTVLSDPLRKRLWKSVLSLNSVRVSPAPIDRDLASRLSTEFAPGVMRLADLLQKDLNSWLVPPASRERARGPATTHTQA